ncbi:MAG: DUF3592 domain-containing protein [Myxococcota bacterium]
MLRSLEKFPLTTIMLVGFGLASLAIGISSGWKGFRLSTFGEATTGAHVESHVKNVADRSGSYRYSDPVTSTTTVDVVAFTTKAGDEVRFNANVPEEREYESFDVIYDPDNPEVACLAPCGSTRTGALFTLIGVTLLVSGKVAHIRHTREHADDTRGA